MSATSPTERPMYSPADLREVEVWLQQFRADGRCDPKQAAATLAERLRATRTAPDLWERVTRTLLAEKDFDGAEVLLRSGLALSAATPKARLPALMGNRQDAHAGFAGVVNDAVGKPLQGKATELSSPRCAKVWLLREKCCRSLELRDEGTPQIRVCRSRVIQTALHKILFRLRREGNPHESAWRAR